VSFFLTAFLLKFMIFSEEFEKNWWTRTKWLRQRGGFYLGWTDRASSSCPCPSRFFSVAPWRTTCVHINFCGGHSSIVSCRPGSAESSS
jgi:hypothetical protein